LKSKEEEIQVRLEEISKIGVELEALEKEYDRMKDELDKAQELIKDKEE